MSKKTSLIIFLYSYGNICLVHIILAIAYSIFNKIVLTLPEFFLGMAINVVLHAPNAFLSRYGIHETTHQLIALASFTAFLWFLSSLLYYLESITWQRFAHQLQHTLRLHTYKKVQKNKHVPEKIGNLVTIMNDDINQIESFFRFAANDTIHLIVGTLMIGGIYLYCSPIVAGIALLPLPLIIFLSIRFQKKLQVNYLITRNQAGKIAEHLTNTLQTNTFNPELLEQESIRYKEIALIAAQTSSVVNPVINALIAFGFMVTIGISGYYVIIGMLSAGTFSIITLQTQRLLWPFARTAQIIDAFERTAASALRIKALIETEEQNENSLQPLNESAEIVSQQPSINENNP